MAIKDELKDFSQWVRSDNTPAVVGRVITNGMVAIPVISILMESGALAEAVSKQTEGSLAVALFGAASTLMTVGLAGLTIRVGAATHRASQRQPNVSLASQPT